jgi:hypothetical protein
MNKDKKDLSIKSFFPTLARMLSVPVLVTAFLWLTSGREISIVQGIISFILLCVPWQSYFYWKQGPRNHLPLLSMIAGVYWLYFAFPLFWGDINAIDATGRLLSDKSLTKAILMAALGVGLIWLGMWSGLDRFITPRRLPDISLHRSRRNYLRLLLVVGTLSSMYDSSAYLLGDGGRQIIMILITIVPSVAFAILFRFYLQGHAARLDRTLIFIYLGARLIIGLSSGWLGMMVGVAIICLATFIIERHKIPRWAIIATILYILFFQVGKEDLRSKYWYGETEGSRIERVSYWVGASLEKWQAAFNDPSGASIRAMADKSISRTSLLPQAANVLEMTPAVVPYQYGALYYYMGVTMIPRFVWPDKPSVNDANQFYQVNYGITEQENLKGVSISVGTLTEGYINFGWVGVVGIMFLLGIFYGAFQRIFLTDTSSILFHGIGMALLPQLLGIEAQMAAYLGGILQQVLLTLLVFSPIIVPWRARAPLNLSTNPS